MKTNISRQREEQIRNQAAGKCLHHKDRDRAPNSKQFCPECLLKWGAYARDRYRYKVGGETRKFTCKNCGESGHNSRTCKQPLKRP